MNHYVWMAVQQQERLHELEALFPNRTMLENRLAFFGKEYEIHISYCIMHGLAAINSSVNF